MMRQQDVVSIMITFAFGFFAGGYLYLTHFSKLVAPDETPTQAEVLDLSIIGEAYGSCGSNCPSFQVLANGQYRYQYVPAIGEEKIISEGTLPLSVFSPVKKNLSRTSLLAQSELVEPPDCNSRNEGIDVRYMVTYEGTEYRIDSCGTRVDGSSGLWLSLSDVWSYFNTNQ